jgi:NADPH-dependent ferric siderophore reductase
MRLFLVDERGMRKGSIRATDYWKLHADDDE